ncbi:MAG: BREX-1 system phosphatase PglZ type A [Muribaculaceae bacterium]|nr:BREX-1 system phosphatase PglZ type A [Muribaculaceae bacterium]
MKTQDRIFKYFETNSRLRVLFIFEGISMISDTLNECVWPEEYLYKIFEGDWFSTKYHLENDWKDKKVILVFRDVTMPQTESQQLEFPLMDVLKANMEYREDDYAAFMQQYRIPEKHRVFIKRHVGELQSSKVMNIIEDYLSPDVFSEDLAIRSIISSYLGDKKLLDWESIILRMILLGRKSEESKRINFFLRVEKNRDVKAAIDDRLNRIFGVSYNPNTIEKMEDVVQSLKYNSITQLLAPNSADSYKSLKINSALRLQQINRIFDLGISTKQWRRGFEEALEELASNIRESELIDVYGIDAQYYAMTEALIWPILNHILEVSLLENPAETRQRVASLTMKFNENGRIISTLDFIDKVAAFYEKKLRLGSIKLSTPQDYIERYTSDFYLFDQLYRKALEAHHKLISEIIPIIPALEQRKHQLDVDYARLVNDINLEWMDCVTEYGEDLSSVSIPRQEDFYKREYAGTGGKNKLVVIISDALRYEVAQELLDTLGREKHMAKLSANLSMLPTETKYCKQALLPHKRLTLVRNENGVTMAVDGQILSTIEMRSNYLASYRADAICIKYSDYVKNNLSTNRDVFKHPLVYLYHDTIDDTGHGQNPVDVIEACRRSVEQLSSLVKSLHASMNVVNVIVTSDHGFLYNEIEIEDKDKLQIQDSDIEKKTRYYLTTDSQCIQGIVKFPLDKVSSIESAEPVYVGVPKGTNRIAAAGGYNFVHGGASLQEMIVPVIHSSQRRSEKTDFVGVSLLTYNLTIVSSRLKLNILQEDVVDMTMLPRTIVCAIYQGDKAVSNEVSVTLDSNEPEPSNRISVITLTLNQSVTPGLLQLRIYDAKDVKRLNPLVKETVKNNTIIEQDFF